MLSTKRRTTERGGKKIGSGGNGTENKRSLTTGERREGGAFSISKGPIKDRTKGQL